MLTNDQRRELGALARDYDLPEAHVLAVVDVESNGTVFAAVNGRDEPLILNEPHVFYRRLAGREREVAVAQGLAYAKWGSKPYPNTQIARWKWIDEAAQINRQAAYESVSYGVGQVLGMHWKALGFASIEQFVQQARSGLRGQADIMLRFIRTNNLEDELREGRWAPFARGYNGSQYAKNAYDTKLKAAAAKYGGADADAAGMLRMGSKGRRVRELQALLIRAGYSIKEDGDFGPSTKKVLQDFQAARGVTADGIYGPQTERMLAELRQAPEDNPGHQPLTKVVAVQKGVGGGLGGAVTLASAKEVLQDAAYQVSGVGTSLRILDYVQTGLTIGITICTLAGLAYAVHGWLKSKRTVEA